MYNWKNKRHAISKIRKKWRILDATDFQSLMYPCFMFCRILGIFPYKINSATFQISKPYYIVSTVIICAFCLLDMIVVYNLITSEINIGSTAKNLELCCYYVFSGFIMTSTYVLSSPRMRLLQTLLEISSKLSSKSYQKLSKLIYIDILGITYLAVQMYIFWFKYLFIKHDEKLNYFVIRYIIGIYFYVLTFQLNMLYVNCVCVLKACFESISDNLAHMRIFITSNIKSCELRLIRQAQRSQCLLIQLKTLRKWHLMITEAVKMLNTNFSLQLLAIIIMSFSNITLQIYIYAVRWQDGILFSFDINFFYYFVTTIGYYIVIIILLLWACESSKNEAQKIKTTVHDVLSITNNEEIKNELQLFSLQILQHKNIFSAKSLTIDATLFTAMISNIMIYTLILIQFLILEHSCDEKYGNNIANNSIV